MQGRLEIFQIHTRRMPFSKEIQLDHLAGKTHGFVGADIAAVCREAGMAAMRRYLPQIDLDAEVIPQEFLDTMEIMPADFEEAQKEVLPSAIREVFIELPSVYWSDVGGLDGVKQELIEAVEWPLKIPEAYRRMGI